MTAATHTQQPEGLESALHAPVMADAVLAALDPCKAGVYVDATFGRGGYSRAMLEAGAGHVWAIDRDPEAVAAGADLAAAHPGRLNLVRGRFGDLDRLLPDHGIDAVDGIAFDLGVSSPQIETPERGFSFRHDGPLDMRMSPEGPSAAEVVNEMPESDLAGIIRDYGEEKKARRVAKAIVAARARGRITRTGALAEIVRGAVGPAKGNEIDPATRTFQALRIHVNDELGELQRGLRAAEFMLREGGRLVVVAFHSLEDRLVKQFLRERSGDLPRASRHSPIAATEGPAPTFSLIERKAGKPTNAEAAANPRARSARLRAAVRTAAPARPDAGTGDDGGGS